jgi:bifunctional non-homologous end joining protein LigD
VTPVTRSGAWLKYKVNKAQAFVIGGYTPDNPLDALIIGYYEGDKLIFASKVATGSCHGYGSGVEQAERLRNQHLSVANLPEKRTQWALTREEMKNCIWVKPELVGQVEFTPLDA